MTSECFENLYITEQGLTPEQAKETASVYLGSRLRESIPNNAGFSADSPVSQASNYVHVQHVKKDGTKWPPMGFPSTADATAWGQDNVPQFDHIEVVAAPSTLSRESARDQRKAAQQVELREAYRRFVAEGRI
ncbi:MAG: hypothetical protein ACR2NN_29085 [Bryobacteraceae bacterium]